MVFLKSLSLALWDQVYRVSDLELVSVLPSAQDEVNVACFHPYVGGGLVYGTKVCHLEHQEFPFFGWFGFELARFNCLVNSGRKTEDPAV